jgi:hypothetical protein
MGKSQMLRAVSSLAPRGVYVSGQSASTAGLTVTVVQEKGTGDATLEAGALVLSDQGVCAVRTAGQRERSAGASGGGGGAGAGSHTRPALPLRPARPAPPPPSLPPSPALPPLCPLPSLLRRSMSSTR